MCTWVEVHLLEGQQLLLLLAQEHLDRHILHAPADRLVHLQSRRCQLQEDFQPRVQGRLVQNKLSAGTISSAYKTNSHAASLRCSCDLDGPAICPKRLQTPKRLSIWWLVYAVGTEQTF